MIIHKTRFTHLGGMKILVCKKKEKKNLFSHLHKTETVPQFREDEHEECQQQLARGWRESLVV